MPSPILPEIVGTHYANFDGYCWAFLSILLKLDRT